MSQKLISQVLFFRVKWRSWRALLKQLRMEVQHTWSLMPCHYAVSFIWCVGWSPQRKWSSSFPFKVLYFSSACLSGSFAISKNYTLISVFKKALIVDLEVRKPHPRSQSVVPSHSLPWVTTMIAHEKSLAGLAQSVERLTEEREVARSIPRAGPVFRVLK